MLPQTWQVFPSHYVHTRRMIVREPDSHSHETVGSQCVYDSPKPLTEGRHEEWAVDRALGHSDAKLEALGEVFHGHLARGARGTADDDDNVQGRDGLRERAAVLDVGGPLARVDCVLFERPDDCEQLSVPQLCTHVRQDERSCRTVFYTTSPPPLSETGDPGVYRVGRRS